MSTPGTAQTVAHLAWQAGVWRRRGLRAGLVCFGVLAVLMLAGAAFQQLMVQELEHEGIEVKMLGLATPTDFGVSYETLSLPVGNRVIQARLVRGAAADANAVLIFHGNGEALSDWSQAQATLHAAGISSMVFDYSGFGASTGVPSVNNLRADGQAAYRAFVERLPGAKARFVLGHSLGNAVMLDALPTLSPEPQGVLVHAAFTSAREMAVQTGLASRWLARLLPDVWDNQQAMARPGPAVLVLHSDADEVIPPEMGLRLADAAGARANFQRLSGLAHDALFLQPSVQEWQPMIDFIGGRPVPGGIEAAQIADASH